MSADLNPQFVFDTFVIGPSNRLAAGAARRVAETPAQNYNPLVIYGDIGVGKTHLLHALGHLARAVRPNLSIEYSTAERYVEALASAVAAGTYHFQEEHLGLGLLLLDDIQYLAGKGHTQAELLWIWEAMVEAGEQVVLASGRPLGEIDSLDERLISRFPGGLIVELNSPDLDTRTAIVEATAAAQQKTLDHGVARAVARVAYGNVRDLVERLAKVVQVQEIEGRALGAAEVFSLFGSAHASPPAAQPAAPPAQRSGDEVVVWIDDISSTVAEVVDATPWRQTLAAAILRWEGEGIRTRRLEEALQGDQPADLATLINGFAGDVTRLRAIRKEVAALDPQAADSPLLTDPDLLAEAERWLTQVRARGRSGSARSMLTLAAAKRGARGESSDDGGVDAWFFDRERIAWSYIGLEDRLIEALN